MLRTKNGMVFGSVKKMIDESALQRSRTNRIHVT